MESLKRFAKTEKLQYPKLEKAINSLNEMVGMNSVKEAVAEEIKTVLAYDLLDKPQRTSPVQTRSRSVLAVKRKKTRTHTKTKKQTKKQKTMLTEDNDQEEDANTGCTTLGDFLKHIQEHGGGEDLDWEDNEDKQEETPSIRTKRMKNVKLHTLLLGKPGTGKTTLAKKLHGIWEAIGLVTEKFTYVTKGDLASKWQGASLEMIRNMIHEYSNGVIFIDEAYSMVSDSKDSYGNEMLNYIVHSMTDPECTTTFIFAGYAEMIKNNLFGANEGLSRRFQSIFVLEKPNALEMAEIFIHLCRKQKGWKCIVSKDQLQPMFQESYSYFKDAGGDVEGLVLCTYKAHVNRYFPHKMNQRIIKEDVMKGFAIFVRNKNKKASTPNNMSHMYL
jgi:energy-coupling factor transporter ATP-binding protein EcfA2